MKSQKLKAWARKKATSRGAWFTLGALSLTESCCFIIPADIMMPPMIIAHPEKWKRVAFVIVITSLIGGTIGFFIGVFAFESFGNYLLDTFNLHNSFAKAETLFRDYAVLAILVGAITPIPYKVIAIASGVFGVGFIPFLGLSVIGRCFRYYGTSYLLFRGTRLAAGKKVKKVDNTESIKE